MHQVHGMSTGAELHRIPVEMAEPAVRQYMGQRENSELYFASLKRMLAAEDPRFREAVPLAAQSAIHGQQGRGVKILSTPRGASLRL